MAMASRRGCFIGWRAETVLSGGGRREEGRGGAACWLAEDLELGGGSSGGGVNNVDGGPIPMGEEDGVRHRRKSLPVFGRSR